MVGTHILETDESITVYGKAFLIKNGSIVQICDNKETYNIYAKNGNTKEK